MTDDEPDSEKATDTDADSPNDDAENGPARDDEFGLDTDLGTSGEDESAGADADAPLSSLASSVDERRGRNADRPDDELFSEESVAEIDADVVWDRLEDEDLPELPEDDDPDVRVVKKRSYCEQCPFFSAPPEVSCTNDGTEILELVDMDHFRVVDCPKVREDERLERL